MRFAVILAVLALISASLGVLAVLPGRQPRALARLHRYGTGGGGCPLAAMSTGRPA